jgi:acetolactate synthase-1/2/3 large subunit
MADPVRPTHLDFNGLQGDVIELGQTDADVEIDHDKRRLPVHRPVADDRDIERAAKLLAGARRLAIVAGDGAAASGAGPEILALAETLAAPVATTLGARGIIPTRHRLSAGVAGSYSAPPANRIVHGADMVLFIGCDTGDQVTLNWTIPPLATPVVQIDADPLEIGRSYPNTTGVVGDPKATVARLNQIIGKPVRDSGFAEEAARIVADWRASVAPLAGRDTAPISVERLCAEITKALPADGVLVADTGYSGIWTGTMIDLNGAGQTYLRAAGSLGWAFPAALGAQCAAGPRRVVCFTGDGGFYYHLAELETARRYQIPSVTVVNNNSGFGQNLTGVHRISGNRPGRGEELIRFGPTDFTKVAASFGVRGIRVERPSEIAPALAQALAANEPVIVDVVTELEPRAPEAWSPAR